MINIYQIDNKTTFLINTVSLTLKRENEQTKI
jgi:hypothetical protein